VIRPGEIGGHLGWIITRDLLHEQDPETHERSNVGRCGPGNIWRITLDALRQGKGLRWRMLDDDGEVCYEGLLLDTRSYMTIPFSRKTERSHRPLDDFGMPDSGCTSIEYLEEDGVAWTAL
jgi:hypothetical protein